MKLILLEERDQRCSAAFRFSDGDLLLPLHTVARNQTVMYLENEP